LFSTSAPEFPALISAGPIEARLFARRSILRRQFPALISAGPIEAGNRVGMVPMNGWNFRR